MQPIFELEIVNEIMHTLRKSNLGFYQRKLSYQHCDIVNQLEEIAYHEKSEGEKIVVCISSLPFCNGEYLIPLLNKLRIENIEYSSIATEILLHQFYIKQDYFALDTKGSFLEQLFSWMSKYMKMYEKKRRYSFKGRTA